MDKKDKLDNIGKNKLNPRVAQFFSLFQLWF